MELIMLVGIPGSGKSTLSTQFAAQGYRVYSSDSIRAELYGSEEEQGTASEVFNTLIRRLRRDLSAGVPCVVDACNLRRKRRISLLKMIPRTAMQKRCILVLTSPETCLERNRHRRRTVPPEVIYDMLCAFEAPFGNEGWESIEATCGGAPYAFPRGETTDFTQDNPHHQLSLGAHMDAARDYCIDHGFDAAVIEAAWYHDIGKLYTKRFRNKRGEPTEVAHFYGHENYGAYLYLCEKAVESIRRGTWAETLYVANLINWHMRPLNVWLWTPKSEEKDRALIGEEMYADLCRLHAADLAAH